MFRLPRLLDPQVAPTAAFQLGGRAVYTTHHSVGYRPRVVVSLRIRIGQLIRLDSHQLDYSLVGCSNVRAFMYDLFRQGAFQGRSSSEAYFVKCDHETTSQADVSSGIVSIVVWFAPIKPAEFVIIKIQQLAGQILP